MSTKYPGLTIKRIRPQRPDALRAWASLVIRNEKMYFCKETKLNGNRWCAYVDDETLYARTLKELLAVWRLTR